MRLFSKLFVAAFFCLSGTSMAHAAAPASISDFNWSAKSVETGHIVHVAAALTAKKALTQTGTLTLFVLDPKGNRLGSFQSSFGSLALKAQAVVAGDFTVPANGLTGTYKLQAYAVSPELNINSKANAFAVVLPKAYVQMNTLGASQTMVAPGTTISYFGNTVPSRTLVKSGTITMSLQNAAGKVVDKGSVKFQTLPGGVPFHTVRTYKVPSNLALGAYTVAVSANSSEVSGTMAQPNALLVSHAINGACGQGASANGIPATLCSAGTASAPVLNGSSYSWSCNGAAGGTASACSATYTPTVNGICGASAGTTGATAPTQLCNAGVASAPILSGNSYAWTCSGAAGGASSSCAATYAAQVNGTCGASSGIPTSGMPGALCAFGTASTPLLSGNRYTWSCTGSMGGTTSSCAATLAAAVSGVCGASSGQPTIGTPGLLCQSGTASTPILSGNRYTWSCTGSTGTGAASCAANLQGATCGSSAQQSLHNTPRTNLCTVGTASAVIWTPQAYSWTCSDTATVSSASCAGAYAAPANSLTAFKGAGDSVGSDIATFNSWLGRDIDYYIVNFNQDNWSALVSSLAWAINTLPLDKRMVASIPMLTANDYSGTFWADGVEYKNMTIPKGTLAMGAAGYYDSYWLLFAKTLVKYGRGNAIVRLGWEMNLNEQPWNAASDPAGYKTYFARIVGIMRSVPGANFEFDWCPNIHTHTINPELVYPGDAYVDYIGQDVYDQVWSDSLRDPVARWNYYYTAPNGIKWMLDFANAHGKKKSFPEWGAGGGYSAPGVGDSPYFIQQMAQVIKTNNISYSDYWDTNAAYQGMLSNGQYPLMAAEFIKDFGVPH